MVYCTSTQDYKLKTLKCKYRTYTRLKSIIINVPWIFLSFVFLINLLPNKKRIDLSYLHSMWLILYLVILFDPEIWFHSRVRKQWPKRYLYFVPQRRKSQNIMYTWNVISTLPSSTLLALSWISFALGPSISNGPSSLLSYYPRG